MRFFQAEKVGNGTPFKISRRRRRMTVGAHV
jgi:hypothetical protein